MTTLFRKARANPFDKSAIGAKIPDGKATVSNAMRVQGIKEFALPVTGNTPSLLFFPGLNNSVLLDQSESSNSELNEATDTRTTVSNAQVARSVPSTTHIEFACTANAGTSVDSRPSTFAGSTEKMIKWRIVSSAMRVQMVNNADENEGWFEAIRVDPNWQQNVDGLDRFQLEMGATNADTKGRIMGTVEKTPGTTLVAIDNAGFPLPFVKKSDDWINHPSYVSGKIRDIHHYMWKLNSTAKDHDFIDGVSEDVTSTTGFRGKEVLPWLDTSYDCIAIRFHPKVEGSPTRLVIHSCVNQELIFDESSILSSSATKCYNRLLSSAGDSVSPTGISSRAGFGSYRLGRYRRSYRTRGVRRSYSTSGRKRAWSSTSGRRRMKR